MRRSGCPPPCSGPALDESERRTWMSATAGPTQDERTQLEQMKRDFDISLGDLFTGDCNRKSKCSTHPDMPNIRRAIKKVQCYRNIPARRRSQWRGRDFHYNMAWEL